jgi:hypothetical protein
LPKENAFEKRMKEIEEYSRNAPDTEVIFPEETKDSKKADSRDKQQTSKFRFTEDQIENLRKWKNVLSSERARKWTDEENRAESETTLILNSQKFADGEDLSPEKLDLLFSRMKWFYANRNLSNILYRTNGLEEFNSGLRRLIHGSDNFPVRVNNFFKLKNIGIQTLSQFLVAADSRKYPFVTSQTKEALAISSEQDQSALSDAIKKFEIVDSNGFLERTLDYLRDCIIFESVKTELQLEKYTQVNNILWFVYDKEEGPEEAINSYGSISIENDLREFLAKNIFLVERGLTLVKKEFDTKEVGRIDLLCTDRKGNHVIVELKRDRKSDEVVGQILRYIGWVEKNMNAKARGIIIVGAPDERLQYAISALRNMVELKYYSINFQMSEHPFNQPTLDSV